jgi:hypothetical protein
MTTADTMAIIDRRLERLNALRQLDAPGIILANAAWILFKACLVHSENAINIIGRDIIESEKRDLGICWSQGCKNAAADRSGLCAKCIKEIEEQAKAAGVIE